MIEKNNTPLTYEENLLLVSRNLPENEILAQLAEEASELTQAALKVRRASGFINETPVGYEKAIDNLIEEIADVQVCIDAVTAADPHINSIEPQTRLRQTKEAKAKRWVERLNIR